MLDIEEGICNNTKGLSLKATAIGSLPFCNPEVAIDFIFKKFSKNIPFIPQLANVSRYEDMVSQLTQNVPGVLFDEKKQKFVLNEEIENFYEQLEQFYMDYEEIIENKNLKNLDRYGITPPFISTFELFLGKIKDSDYDYVKTQICGPFTWSTAISNIGDIAIFYDETLRDIAVKSLILKAVWQIEKIKEASSRTIPIVFIDEPNLANVSACTFLSVKMEEVIKIISQIVSKIKDFGGISAIHCCGRANWSEVIKTGVDILNFDAFCYAKSLGLYYRDIDRFLSKGGLIAFGIVPTLNKKSLEDIEIEELVKIFESSIEVLTKKGISRDRILRGTMFTPSCGTGGLDDILARKALDLLIELSEYVKKEDLERNSGM